MEIFEKFDLLWWMGAALLPALPYFLRVLLLRLRKRENPWKHLSEGGHLLLYGVWAFVWCTRRAWIRFGPFSVVALLETSFVVLGVGLYAIALWLRFGERAKNDEHDQTLAVLRVYSWIYAGIAIVTTFFEAYR